MPYLRIEMVEGVSAETRRELLRRTAEVFAEITESPLERIRTLIVELPADAFAVGGVPVADSGVQAPFITIDVLAGRPPEQHQALIERISPLVAEIVGCPLDRVRTLVVEVPPQLWGIAGVPAASARRAEIDARRTP
ncbi:MAG: tautomerase family protein [Actinobacteria bacterium]|nr:tautomerase family protein [Actinomycetota bacterium]